MGVGVSGQAAALRSSARSWSSVNSPTPKRGKAGWSRRSLPRRSEPLATQPHVASTRRSRCTCSSGRCEQRGLVARAGRARRAPRVCPGPRLTRRTARAASLEHPRAVLGCHAAASPKPSRRASLLLLNLGEHRRAQAHAALLLLRRATRAVLDLVAPAELVRRLVLPLVVDRENRRMPRARVQQHGSASRRPTRSPAASRPRRRGGSRGGVSWRWPGRRGGRRRRRQEEAATAGRWKTPDLARVRARGPEDRGAQRPSAG